MIKTTTTTKIESVEATKTVTALVAATKTVTALERLASTKTKRKTVTALGRITGKDLILYRQSNKVEYTENSTINLYISLKLEELQKVLNEIEKINIKGYVNSFDLNDSRKYPIFSQYLNSYLLKDISYLDSKDLINITKWTFNIILLNLYKEYKFLIDLINLNNTELNDKSLELSVYVKEIINKLDPSIRIHLRKSGVSFILNTYTGFDTEYQNIDSFTNKLLSVQLAVSSRILVKLPLTFTQYSFSQIDTLKGTIYKMDLNSKLIKYGLINDTLTNQIKSIRNSYFLDYDNSIDNIIKELKRLSIPFTIKDQSIIFMFNKSQVSTWFNSKINQEEGIGLKDLLMQSNDMSSKNLDKGMENIYNLFKDIFNNSIKVKNLPLIYEDLNTENQDLNRENPEVYQEYTENIKRIIKDSKKFTRTNKQSFSQDKIVVTIVRNNYFIGHLTSADLSMLNDFDKLKNEFDIVNGGFVTLKSPLLIDNVNLILRDTMLLSPGGHKSLKSIGSLYGEDYKKIDIGNNIHNMENFLKTNYELFKTYAIQDALISLTHAMFMEEFVFKMGVVGVPLTLSSISNAYIKNKWIIDNYKGYQLSNEYLIGETGKTLTPKGLNGVGLIGLYINFYIGNYKGGRNESFMYGINKELKIYDYDLISAYTTGMALMGDPDYNLGVKLTKKELDSLSNKDLILSYTVIKTSFEFPKTTKYPSIPCFVDKDTTVYPLNGDAILTGAEYVLAKEQGCKFRIFDIFSIPFKEPIKKSKDIIIPAYQPFFSTIKELQSSRAKHPKGSINNLLYKELGNSLYGLVVKGISNKMKYDTRLKTTIRMEGGYLSNPIIASWITGFIRSVLGELLHNIDYLNGKIVSVTTDGFITDIEDLENKILKLPKNRLNLLNTYKESRTKLSGISTALETKKDGVSIISWTTRGQFSLNANILAATGFQRGSFNFLEIEKLLEETMNSKNKEIVYINHRLRSALDIFKKGGHVTSVFKDQTFRMVFDNRRVIQDKEKDFKETKLLDSLPIIDINETELLRYLGKLPTKNIYQKNTISVGSFKSTYKNITDLAIRNFVRGLLKGEFNLDPNYFKNYKELCVFINNYKEYLESKESKDSYNNKFQLITPNIVAQLKRRNVIPKKLPQSKSTEKFLEYVKKTFPDFDSDKFYNRLQ